MMGVSVGMLVHIIHSEEPAMDLSTG
jgi:hypothetical protein